MTNNDIICSIAELINDRWDTLAILDRHLDALLENAPARIRDAYPAEDFHDDPRYHLSYAPRLAKIDADLPLDDETLALQITTNDLLAMIAAFLLADPDDEMLA